MFVRLLYQNLVTSTFLHLLVSTCIDPEIMDEEALSEVVDFSLCENCFGKKLFGRVVFFLVGITSNSLSVYYTKNF